jgi:hypothetical protein
MVRADCMPPFLVMRGNLRCRAGNRLAPRLHNEDDVRHDDEQCCHAGDSYVPERPPSSLRYSHLYTSLSKKESQPHCAW